MSSPKTWLATRGAMPAAFLSCEARLGREPIAGDVHDATARHVLREPARALLGGLRVRVDRLDLVERASRVQTVRDEDSDLVADL